MRGILVGSKCSASSTLYSRPTPNRLIATTNSPLTAPPRSAIWSALLRLERAALAVRMFERTATYMPTMPACTRSEEHTSELQSLAYLVCRLLLEKKKTKKTKNTIQTRKDK